MANDLDRIEATPSRLDAELPWSDEAKELLDQALAQSPILVRISAARRLRDAAERDARGAGHDQVTSEFVHKARKALFEGSRS